MIILFKSIQRLNSGDLFRIIHTKDSNTFDTVVIFSSLPEKMNELSIIQQTRNTMGIQK